MALPHKMGTHKGCPYIGKMGRHIGMALPHKTGTHKGCPYGTILLLIILQGIAEGEDRG